MSVFRVRWKKSVTKQLQRIPSHIARKFYAWAQAVTLVGVGIVRQSPGFHDEPLHGGRMGERSVRLSRAYRAIYGESKDGEVEIVEVLEVNRHDY